MLLEFDITIKDEKGVKNVVADEQLMAVTALPWYADIVNSLVLRQIPGKWSAQDKKKFLSVIRHFYFEDPYLFKY